jgi:MerR family copper efflux transcriptional regulator
MRDLTIGKAARDAGVGVETIRFYEREGLIQQPPKGAGYRTYAPDLVARIRFIRQAQGIGFSLKETRELLALRADPKADCAEVRAQAEHKIAEVDGKIAELLRVRAALETVVASCPGQGGLEGCTILEALEDTPRRRVPCGCEEPREDTTMKNVILKVEGLRCASCAASVGSLLDAHAGVRGADVSFEEGRARVLYDPATTSEDRLVALIEKRGFRVVARDPA